MTQSEWQKLTPQERNERVAVALGWELFDEAKSDEPYYWIDNGGNHHQYLPDFQGSDATAFSELWPSITAFDADLILRRIRKSEDHYIPAVQRIVFEEEEPILFATVSSADTWAEVLCIAFLAMKEDSVK